MLLLVDSADVGAIRRIADLFPIAGVTTNPTLVARERRPFAALLADIRAAIGPATAFHAQVTGTDAATMVAEAEALAAAIGEGFHPKVPLTAEGLKAIRLMRARGLSPTATAVVAPMQALMAARAGAEFVAPYVNRLDAAGGDGVGVVGEIARLLALHGLPTRILAASFKTVQQVRAVALAGAHAATIAPDLFEPLIHHPLTDQGLAGFAEDWAAVYGAGTTATEALARPDLAVAPEGGR